MPRAVLRDGLIHPLEPLPPDWRDGQELRVESAEPEPAAHAIDEDFRELAALCAAGDPADDDRLDRSLGEARRLAKDQVRRQMGLPE